MSAAHPNQYRIHSDEIVEKMKELWEVGELSASQIAAQLGMVSRNAVISKMHQLGIKQGKRAAPKKVAGPKPPKPLKPLNPLVPLSGPVRPLEQDPEIIEIIQPPRAPQTGVAFFDLKPNHCRFPLGGRMDPAVYFCGEPKDSETSYCRTHHKICLVPPKPRKHRPQPVKTL
jgi:hypothetical protein